LLLYLTCRSPAGRAAGTQLRAEFVDTPELGQSEWREPRQYDAATCMFAIHYFFVSEAALKQLLHNVWINLKDGAHRQLTGVLGTHHSMVA